MAETVFKFQETEETDETTDIQLCANRWKLYHALSEIDSLVRKLYNSKTYNTKFFYPIDKRKDEFGREETIYSQEKPDRADAEKSVEFVEVNWIVNELSQAIEDIRFMLDC